MTEREVELLGGPLDGKRVVVADEVVEWQEPRCEADHGLGYWAYYRHAQKLDRLCYVGTVGVKTTKRRKR